MREAVRICNAEKENATQRRRENRKKKDGRRRRAEKRGGGTREIVRSGGGRSWRSSRTPSGTPSAPERRSSGTLWSFSPLPAQFDDSESKNGANFLVCILRQIQRARRKGVARKGQVSSAGNTSAGYERIRRMEPSPVWTVSAPPPPLILPRTSDLLMTPSTVTGNPRLMRPSLVWASRSA